MPIVNVYGNGKGGGNSGKGGGGWVEVGHGGGCGVVWVGAPWLGPWAVSWIS